MFKKALSLLLSLMLIVASLSVTILSVSAADNTYYVSGVEDLCGVNWAQSPGEAGQNNMMTAKDDGTYEKVYTNVAVKKAYELKVLTQDATGVVWYGNELGNNIVFNVVSECDVTVTFNPNTKEITVTGDGVEKVTGLIVDAMYAVGGGSGSWLNGVNWGVSAEENVMTEVTPGVYQITFEDVEASFDENDFYEFKFAANGTWADQWGAPDNGYVIPLNQTVDAACNSNTPNILLNIPGEPDDLFDVTLTIDVSGFNYNTKLGAKMRVDAVKSSGDNEDETTIPVTTEAPTTEAPTTEAPTTVPTPAGNLTVKTTSNLFPEKTATYDAGTKELTVSYYLGADKALLNTQWTLKYDPTILSVSDKNNVNSVMPVTGGNGFTLNLGVDGIAGQGLIKGNASNLSLYDLSKPFVSVVFDVIGSAEGSLTTEVNLNVEGLTVSKVGANGLSDPNEEVTLVQDSVINDNSGVNVWFEEGQQPPTGEASYLTVKATSNYFPEATASYSENMKEVTVTYLFQSPKNVLNTQWVLKYDPNVLSLSSKNNATTVSPVIGTNGATYNLNEHPGEIYGTASNLGLYDFSTLQPFVTVVFDVKDISAIAPVSTVVDLEVQVLTVSKVDANGMSDESEEVTLVKDSVVLVDEPETYIRKTVLSDSDIVPTTEETTAEEPTTKEPATPDEPTTVVPEPATDATSTVGGPSTGDTPSAPVPGGSVNGGGNGAVQTGDASMALIILSVLVSATGAMFFARKRIK